MYDYKLIRSKRKTIAVEISPLGEVFIRAPKWLSREEVEKFAASREQWVKKTLAKLSEKRAALEAAGENVMPLTEGEIKELTREAKKEMKRLVEFWEPAVFSKSESIQLSIFDLGIEGLSNSNDSVSAVNKISVRHQSTRWGSCSKEGNLSFNCLLMLTPPWVRDYVVVHELCHLLHMNHSKAFWKEVARVLPGYRKAYNWLKENESLLLARLPKSNQS